jgi:dihydroorotate dehydrogenase
MKMKATTLFKWDHYWRPWLAKSLPPKWLVVAYSQGRTPFLKALSEEEISPIEAPRRLVELWGLRFRNDISNAAGFDKDGTLLKFNHAIGAGFTVVGTVLNRTHSGNLFSALGRTFNPWVPLPASSSAINSLGLPGKGIDPVLDRIKAFQDTVQPVDYPIGLSVMGHPGQQGQAKLDGVLECMEKALPVVDFIEINESCPNVANHDPGAFEHRIKSFCDFRNSVARHKPLWVKFGSTPSEASLQLMDQYGVEAVVLLNTQTDYEEIRTRLPKADIGLFDYYTRNFKGGVSGRVIQGDAAEAVEEVGQTIRRLGLGLKIIHVGGLGCKGDMDGSRTLAPLREWYTGLMESLARHKLQQVYPQLFK